MVAEFEIAYKRTLGFEGGEKMTDDPDDPGGPTKFGIAKNYWPKYWLDEYGAYREPDEVMAEFFFRNEFWDAMRGDEIDDQLVANEIFDTAVNCGPYTHRFVQEVYNALTTDMIVGRSGVWPELGVDANIGPRTLAAINRFTQHSTEWRNAMLGALDFRQGDIYWNGKAKFRRGWFANRVGGHHGA